MCDSCIGAKVGINFNNYKNQLGFFYSPTKVLVYTGFLDTLTDFDISSSYGEILKLSLTGPNPFFNKLISALSKEGFKNSGIDNFIYKSLLIKKHYIEIDEYDIGLRRKLNYGHTFGHALETVTDYEIPHGLAVAWGVDLANWISFQRGLLKEGDFLRIHELIKQYFKFTISKKVSAPELCNFMKRDKKVAVDKINLILLKKLGILKIVPATIDNALELLVSEYLRNINISN